MSGLDTPFTAVRVWWRGASNGPRSKAVAVGAAALAFLTWIAVPSGGGALANFTAAGLPAGAGTQSGNAGAPPGGQGAQLVSSASGLGPAPLLPEAVGTPVDNGGQGAASGDSAGTRVGSVDNSESLAPDTGAGPGTPGGPTTPAQACPVPFPATNTPLDGVAAQLSALCTQVAPGSGSVAAGALPGTSAGATSAPVPKQWMFLDAPLGASGASNPAWGPGLGLEMTGKTPTVPVGLVQGSTVSPALAGTVADLVHHGVLVEVVVVPEPTAAGGPSAFASWVARVLTALGPVQLVEIGTGAPPRGSSPTSVAAYTAAGLAAADDAAGRPAAGVLWLDDGTVRADAALWPALDSAGVWSKSSFVARSLDAAGACTSPAQFVSILRRYPVAATLPVVSEAVQAPASASGLAADSDCVRASVAQHPAASVAMWRLWEGPVSR